MRLIPQPYDYYRLSRVTNVVQMTCCMALHPMLATNGLHSLHRCCKRSCKLVTVGITAIAVDGIVPVATIVASAAALASAQTSVAARGLVHMTKASEFENATRTPSNPTILGSPKTPL